MSITSYDHHPTLRHEERDAVTEDLLHQAALDLEHHVWMFSAHQGH